MLTLIIQLDALRHNYITEKDSPFLRYLQLAGVSGSMVPTFGFEPDAAYFAGLYPEECDGGMHYWYSPDTSPFKFTQFIPGFVRYLPEILQLGLGRAIRICVRKVSDHPRLKCGASTARIPLRFLRYFDFSDRYLPFEPQFAGGSTIFDLLRQHEMSWLFHGSPFHDVRASAVVKRIEAVMDSSVDFVFIHIGDLDGVGHIFGPGSDERKQRLREVDECIREIYELMTQNFDEVNFVVFGDHGMAEVQDTVDIEAMLKKLDLKVGRDYVYFLDSVFARFWFNNGRAEKRVTEMLTDLSQGRVLGREDYVKYRINYSHKKFGELIFWANPGVLIFPNFFQNKTPVKGMHGYAPEFRDQQSAFLIHSPRVKTPEVFEEPVDMRRLFPTMLDLLNIDIPETCKVQSLL